MFVSELVYALDLYLLANILLFFQGLLSSSVNCKMSTSSSTTPLPTVQLIAVAFCLLTESIAATMLIPFVGLYVAFLQDWPAEKAGYASGFLIGLFMLGQVISCKAWSVLSDRYGRKIGVVLGISGSAVAQLLFGASTNIWTCSLWRFVHGLFNGSSLVPKTIIADITNKSNEAKGFMVISLMWGFGLLFGPAIGGFLYDPANSSFGKLIGVTPKSFIGQHPAFLPSLFISVYNFFALVVAILFLKESNAQAVPLADAFPRIVRSKIAFLLQFIQPKLPLNGTGTVIVNQREEGLAPDNEKTNETVGIVTDESPSGGTLTTAGSPAIKKFGFKQAFQFQLTQRVLVISMLISASDMIYAETFPLWGIADEEVGGLGLSASSIGLLVLANSIPSIVANLLFSSVLKWYRDELKFFRATQMSYSLLSFLVGFSPYFGSFGFWFAMLIGVIRKGWESWCWSLLMMVCAQTAPKGKVSLMYAVQQASACVVRCIVPFIGAPLFAWSISANHIFPFNHFLLFIISSIPLVFSWWFTKNIFIPVNEYQWGEEPLRCPEDAIATDSTPKAPTGFSYKNFLGSASGANFDDEVVESDLENASFSSVVSTYTIGIGSGTLQPPVIFGYFSGEKEDPRHDENGEEDVELEVVNR